MARHPSVAYLEEPALVWRYGNARLPNDFFPPRFATDKVKRFIRGRFSSFLVESGKEQLVEKTPSNSLRPLFVNEVFPEARFIHIVRDGRKVVPSAMGQWVRNHDPTRSRIPGQDQKLRHFRKQLAKLGQIPPFEARHYLGWGARELLYKVGVLDRKTWGPRFPGQSELTQVISKEEVCALQWMWSVREISKAKPVIGQGRFIEVRYEDLVSAPTDVTLEILEFCELSCSEDTLSEMTHFVTSESDSVNSLTMDKKTADSVSEWIAPTLREFGYN